MGVVDGDQPGPVFGQIGEEPVETVDDGEVRRPDRREFLPLVGDGSLEERRGQPGRAPEELVVAGGTSLLQCGAEQFDGHAEGHLGLELAALGAEHVNRPPAGLAPGRRQQR